MTVFARSDLMSVSISPQHGGCGNTHSRPVHEGSPAKLWALTCDDGCEDILRSDPHWSAHPADIPETPDEKTTREVQERQGKRDAEDATALSIQEIAKIPGALEKMVKALSGQNGKDDPNQGKQTKASEMDACPNDHKVPTGSKFCPECGANMNDAPKGPADDGSSGGSDDPASPDDTEGGGKPAPAKKAVPAKKAAPARKPASGS